MSDHSDQTAIIHKLLALSQSAILPCGFGVIAIKNSADRIGIGRLRGGFFKLAKEVQ
jgi:hypothetical protein